MNRSRLLVATVAVVLTGAALAALPAPPAADAPQRRPMMALDTNNDGFLTRADLQPMPRR